MDKVNIPVCLAMLLMISCNNSDEGEKSKFQKHRNQVVAVGEISDIQSDILLNPSTRVYLVDDILCVLDMKATDKGIHLFDKNSLQYLSSTGILGKGPGEVVRYGDIFPIKHERAFWMPDYGKQVMMKFSIDEILTDDQYKPQRGMQFNQELLLLEFDFINDTIALGRGAKVTSPSIFNELVGKQNWKTGKVESFGYVHPASKRQRIRSFFALSRKHNLYVRAYRNIDLMTICDLDGNLRYNIYGPQWEKNKDNKKEYFTHVNVIGNYIVASYLGDVGMIFNEVGRPKSNLATKLLVFDLDGNYLKTIETGHKFYWFCGDEENNRIITYFLDRDHSLAYFNLDFK